MSALTPERLDEERRLRRVRFLADLTLGVLYQQRDLTLSEAMNLVNNTRRTILSMFPGKELAYNLLYRPRFDRAIAERFCHRCR